jgi:putative hemolysin
MVSEILIIFGLIMLNGVFAMVEIAVVSARKTKLEHAAANGDRKAMVALRLANNPGKLLSTVQIGMTVVIILTGVYSGAAITNRIASWLQEVPLLIPYSQKLAIVLVFICITFFTLVFGELIPKQIGLIRAETVARHAAFPMKWISIIAHPLIWLLIKPGEIIIKLLNIKPSADSKITEDEIRAIIKEGTEGGEIQEIEQDIVERVFHLGDRKVGSLMTHRTELVWININDTAEKIKDNILSSIHSVYPVCDGNLDKVLGMIYTKNLFTNSIKQEQLDFVKNLQPPLFILENNSAYEVLEKFRETKTHNGLVVDEYGSIVGMVTLNNILEALVGEIPTSIEDVEFEIVKRDDGSCLIDGQLPFYDFVQYFEIQYFDKKGIRFNTMSGFALTHFRRIPHTGEKFTWRDFEFEIVDMDANRIDKILVRRIK